MNIIDVIVASIMVAIMVIGSAGFIVYTKDILVDSENYYEANKFSMATLEKVQPLEYGVDPSLTVGTHDDVIADGLPEGCRLATNFTGTRSYVVNQKYWDDPGTTYDYKEIIVTTSWVHKGQNKSVSIGVLKRNDQP